MNAPIDPSELQDARDDRPAIERDAPAKLNLALAVAAPDASGMHPICSWMVPIDLADHLSLLRLEDDRMSRYAILFADDAPMPSDIDWSITRDLAVRAHRLLEERAGRSLPVQMKLTKHIPVGAGLGGGSSDAAATLLAVNTLFELGLSRDELADCAALLGSDVAFFLDDSPAIVEGLGERITPSPAIDFSAALVLPRFGCATGAVYRAFDDDVPRAFREGDARLLAMNAVLDGATLFNDLAEPAMRVQERLREVVERVADIAGRPAHVTGSGSAVFVVCDDHPSAEDLADDLREALAPDAAAIACRSISA
ncbi:MAG: 4-(cytidine 5'-diphospho)-2-C-methyl-D-erythritol kinase [Planctomycetota bacterium]